MRTIIAIDPGPEQSALVEWNGQIVSAVIEPNNEILVRLRVTDPLPPLRLELWIEMIASYGMPVGREVFETCVWVGRFMEAWTGMNEPKRVTRHEVKIHHCHSSKAKDANIRQALIDKYGAPGTKKNPGRTYGVTSDMWAALAVATYAAETSNRLIDILK